MKTLQKGAPLITVVLPPLAPGSLHRLSLACSFYSSPMRLTGLLLLPTLSGGVF